MDIETAFKRLHVRPDELRLVVYHDCQGVAYPVVARRFAMAFQPEDYVCPLCLTRPGLDGFTYEWALDSEVPPDVARWLDDEQVEEKETMP